MLKVSLLVLTVVAYTLTPSLLSQQALHASQQASHASQQASHAASSPGTPAWQTSAGGRLAFEVAAIKPNTSDAEPSVNFTLGPGDAYASTQGRFVTSGITLLDYLRFAYKLTDGQVEIMLASAPDWVATERFDINAKSELPNPTKDQMRLLMQSLLADRFKLTVHQETRELPVLALVLARPGKLGPQLHLHPLEDRACSNVPAQAAENAGSQPKTEIPGVCGGLVSVGVPSSAARVRIGGRRVTLELLAAQLGQMGHFDRPIVDQTGLNGSFDLVLEWGPDATADSTPPPGPGDQQAFLQEALQDQLGLKLERTKAPSRVLLIDHLDRQPTNN